MSAPGDPELQLTGWVQISPEHSGSLLRLERLLRGRSEFTFVPIEYGDDLYRDAVIDRLAQMGLHGAMVDVGSIAEDGADFVLLEAALFKAAQDHSVVHLVGLHQWPGSHERLWNAFNYHREHIAQRCQGPLLAWLLREDLQALAIDAPDLWAWRSGVFDFTFSQDRDRNPLPVRSLEEGSEWRSVRQLEERRRLIEGYLTARKDLSTRSDAGLLEELGEIWTGLGRLQDAVNRLEDAKFVYQRLDNRLKEALVEARIARLMADQGELDLAVDRLAQKSLPILEALQEPGPQFIVLTQLAELMFRARREIDGFEILRARARPLLDRIEPEAVRARAASRLAEIEKRWGSPAEALRILQQESYPAFERLGDERSRAGVLGKIASILEQQGAIDEALQIRREVIEVYEAIGDERSRAISLGQIADVYEQRGELDDVLRIRQQQLSAFEQLGDDRLRAVTLGKIADVLTLRGELEGALRIRREEEIPVYERLGDERLLVMALGSIADLFRRRGEIELALRYYREKQLPVFERLGETREYAITQVRIASILSQQKRPEEALRLIGETLPIARRLNDVELIASLRFEAAKARLIDGRDDAVEAKTLEDLRESFMTFLQLKRPDGIVGVGLVLSQILTRIGSTDNAKSVLAEVVTAAERIGWTKEATDARSALARLDSDDG